eukprot:6492197-Amphidinium_carterae.2
MVKVAYHKCQHHTKVQHHAVGSFCLLYSCSASARSLSSTSNKSTYRHNTEGIRVSLMLVAASTLACATDRAGLYIKDDIKG